MKRVYILLVVSLAVIIGGYLYTTMREQTDKISQNYAVDNERTLTPEQRRKFEHENKEPAKKKKPFNPLLSKKYEEEPPNRTLIVKAEESANSADLEIVPSMESISKAKNQVWAGAFQLVWNDFMNELVKGPVKFLMDQPFMVDSLNKQMFTTKDISDKAYYKKWGLVSPELKREIENGIWEKFNERSQILSSFDFTPRPLKYFLYVMMKKDLEYEKKFKELQEGYFEGSETPVKYFGILENGDDVKKTVKVLFYNNPKDFAVTLRSKQGDLIHLYRVNTDKTLAEIYNEMKQKTGNDKNDYVKSHEQFKAPKIDFNKTQEFKALYNKPIVSYNPQTDYWEIEKAMERIQFKMDEAGAKMVAEAGIMALGKSIGPAMKKRYFYFTGPYAIFLEEPGKVPYFAAYITDPASIQ